LILLIFLFKKDLAKTDLIGRIKFAVYIDYLVIIVTNKKIKFVFTYVFLLNIAWMLPLD